MFRTMAWLADHWLFILNTISFKALIVPTVVAPAFLALGWNAQALVIYDLYHWMCHQMPERSFFLFDQQMAFCVRDLGMFAGFFASGMAYNLFRGRLKTLPLWLAVVYSLPIAVDGITQLLGWRESTWELRIVTGAFFGLATVWYTFPHFDLFLKLRSRQFKQELAQLA